MSPAPRWRPPAESDPQVQAALLRADLAAAQRQVVAARAGWDAARAEVLAVREELGRLRDRAPSDLARENAALRQALAASADRLAAVEGRPVQAVLPPPETAPVEAAAPLKLAESRFWRWPV